MMREIVAASTVVAGAGLFLAGLFLIFGLGVLLLAAGLLLAVVGMFVVPTESRTETVTDFDRPIHGIVA